MPDDEEQQREQEEQMAREQREREEQEQRERENAERYQREQDQRDLEQEQREQEERSKDDQQKESQKEENAKQGPAFDEQKAISRQKELNNLYREVPLTQRFLSHFVPDSWTHAGRMRKAVQMGQRMMDRGINGNDLGARNNDPKLSTREKVIADYKENHAKYAKEYSELNGAQKFFGRILPRDWTKAGKLRTDMEMNDKFLREKVVLEKYEIRSFKKEAIENSLNSSAAPLANEAEVKEEKAKESNEKTVPEGQKPENENTKEDVKEAAEPAKDLEEKTTEGNEKEEPSREDEKTADLQERLKEDTASELNSSQERYQEEMAMQNTKEMENQQEKEMSNGSK